MELRASRDTRREARLARRRVRLPHKPTAEERRQLEALRAAAGMERKEKIMHIDTQTTPMRVEIEGRDIPSRPARRAWRKNCAR